ncbi:preprotein translocase subunit TatA [Halomicrobium sp. HM KBTZ05]|uniref:preprotein translocase subunit TatA n=1 Tax=Halomicrobium sp. HM KBTZ05 TaxID=3242663 RepID=UPI00355929C7
MPDVIALQIGLPGTQELVIVFLILIMLAAPILLVVGLVVLLLRWLSGDDETDERVAELEREVERLRHQQSSAESDTDDERRDRSDEASRS